MVTDSHTANTAEAIASFALADSGPDTEPDSAFWAGASRIFAESDFYGHPVPNLRTEILLQWTPNNLYVLFVCPYQQLHLKPNPNLVTETYKLWDYDVAEIFIGDDFSSIRRYKEFEVSPQGEWVDLDVDLNNPQPETGWVWQSGIQVAARLDATHSTWFGFVRIPWPSISANPPAASQTFPVNFYRCQGSDPDRKYITWQPVYRPSFHTPECFGVLRLAAP